jgi:hypothetical protein
VRHIYYDEAPVAEPHGHVWVTRSEVQKRQAIWSPRALREFCELTLRKLDAWEAEQAGRITPIKRRRKRGHD